MLSERVNRSSRVLSLANSLALSSFSSAESSADSASFRSASASRSFASSTPSASASSTACCATSPSAYAALRCSNASRSARSAAETKVASPLFSCARKFAYPSPALANSCVRVGTFKKSRSKRRSSSLACCASRSFVTSCASSAAYRSRTARLSTSVSVASISLSNSFFVSSTFRAFAFAAASASARSASTCAFGLTLALTRLAASSVFWMRSISASCALIALPCVSSARLYACAVAKRSSSPSGELASSSSFLASARFLRSVQNAVAHATCESTDAFSSASTAASASSAFSACLRAAASSHAYALRHWASAVKRLRSYMRDELHVSSLLNTSATSSFRMGTASKCSPNMPFSCLRNAFLVGAFFSSTSALAASSFLAKSLRSASDSTICFSTRSISSSRLSRSSSSSSLRFTRYSSLTSFSRASIALSRARSVGSSAAFSMLLPSKPFSLRHSAVAASQAALCTGAICAPLVAVLAPQQNSASNMAYESDRCRAHQKKQSCVHA